MGILAGQHGARATVAAHPRTAVASSAGNFQQSLPAGILGTLLVGAFGDAGVEIFLHHAGVETRDDINGLRVTLGTRHVRLYRQRTLCTLVVYGACGVELVEPGRHGGMVGTIAALVAQAPENDAGVVLVALGHTDGTVQKGIGPVGCRSQRATQSVRLAVGFVHDVHAHGVAQLIPAWTVGIVAEAHGIDVGGFHQLQVFLHQLFSHHAGTVGVVLVAVDTANLDGLSVDEQLASLNADGAETNLLADLFDSLAMGVLQLQAEGIEIRVFGVP